MNDEKKYIEGIESQVGDAWMKKITVGDAEYFISWAQKTGVYKPDNSGDAFRGYCKGIERAHIEIKMLREMLEDCVAVIAEESPAIKMVQVKNYLNKVNGEL